MTIASEQDVQWHDSISTSYAQYLGYSLQLTPEISRSTFGPRDDFSTLGSQVSAPTGLENASSWIPSCAYWTLSNLTRKSNAAPIPIVKISWSVSSGAKAIICLHTHDIRLWLCLARCFFNLLHDCITTFALQYEWNSDVHTSSMCRLCQFDTETVFHLFAGCSLKMTFWELVTSQYSLPIKSLVADEI
ncbi:hypothetical protein RMATCC62417_10868 [Rhizopus microsporus]|nr:hypothetical protein RMATCC62417_10868 [Rhizopus microsporus]